MLKHPRNKKILKRLLLAGGGLLIIGAAIYFYAANLTHDDTADLKPDYKVEAISFIKDFEKDYLAANKKYAEKIIAVTGVVTATLPADSTMNIEMKDTTTGSYSIFVFQQQHMNDAKTLKPGDRITIKGSCSGAIYSEILGTYFISFKRCTVDK